jgi:RNA polymerase sigma-70 factor (ECF subfamily)
LAEKGDLLKKAQSGDKEAFKELIKPYLSRLYGLAFQLTQRHEEANDVAQETVIKAYRSIGSFRGDSEVFTWLSRILRNTILDEVKRAVNRYEEAVETLPETLDSTLEQRQEDREVQELVGEAVQELSPKLREPLVMYDIEGYSYEEIAAILDINVGTVKSRLSRARETLRQKLSARRDRLEGYLPHVAEGQQI